ncbi:MAG TPA: hypothetical protein VEI50_13820 [Nitrospiraceae bacterium]|nr:hypothetical protein [Nitrospiraceae bacterium]
MHMTGRPVVTDRLVDLERTVESLNGQLREMQGELYRATRAKPLSVRLWQSLMPQKEEVFMSAVCNRRIRPNTKVVSHAGSRA